MYRSLRTFNYSTGVWGANQTNSKDGNNVDSYSILASVSFTTEKFDSSESDIQIISADIFGCGNMSYQKSVDGITWINELNQAQTADYSLNIDANETNYISDSREFKGFRRLSWASLATGGTLVIKVAR